MKRADQILLLLQDAGKPLSAAEIATGCDTVVPNINNVLQSLVHSGHVGRENVNGSWLYTRTEGDVADNAKAAVLSSMPLGPTPGAFRAKASAAPVERSDMQFGVFTSGELHIEANGKKIVLSKTQASELIEFVCALPNKLFSAAVPKPASPFASMVHRIADEN